MRRALMTALAGAAAIGLSSPASAAAVLTTVNGPNLDVHIKASTTNTQQDNVQVFGSTLNSGQSADVVFTANTAVHITDGAGYAAISDVAGGGLFTAITSNPDPLFNAYQFSIQLVDASFILVQYQVDGNSTWFNALVGDTANPFAQNGKTLRDYQITSLTDAINTIRVSTCSSALLSSCNQTGTGDGTGAGIFLFKQNSINLATNPPPPVPEPGTWALMLLGFGGIGMALRRRRRSGALMQIA